MEDVWSHIGEFLTNKEIFLTSTTNKEINRGLIFNKKDMLKKLKEDIFIKHTCDNCCPCLLEGFYQRLIEDFKLKRYICSLIERKSSPSWLYKYID
jgi:hypothetical protein